MYPARSAVSRALNAARTSEEAEEAADMPPGNNERQDEAMRDARAAPSNGDRCGLTRSPTATLVPTKSGPTGETSDETVRRQMLPASGLLAPLGDDS